MGHVRSRHGHVCVMTLNESMFKRERLILSLETLQLGSNHCVFATQITLVGLQVSNLVGQLRDQSLGPFARSRGTFSIVRASALELFGFFRRQLRLVNDSFQRAADALLLVTTHI
jgi:hypothetical protein